VATSGRCVSLGWANRPILLERGAHGTAVVSCIGMGSKGSILVGLIVAVSGFAGCASQPTAKVTQLAPPEVGTAVTHGRVSDVLMANSDSNDVAIPRYNPEIITGYPLFETSSSDIFTYDQQPIGVYPGLGYRYTYENRTRVTAP
jgi:hypothetical protein